MPDEQVLIPEAVLEGSEAAEQFHGFGWGQHRRLPAQETPRKVPVT